MKTRILSLMIGAALCAGVASASEPAKAPAAPTAQQQAARAEIERLTQRIEELSKQTGDDTRVRVIVRRSDDAPRAMQGRDGDVQRIEQRWRMPPEAMQGRPGLGIVMAPNPAASGVRIAAVTPESPAAKAGLRTGDVLLSVDGKKIAGNGTAAVESARGLLGDLKQDQTVRLSYAREGKTFDASVKADAIRRVMVFNREGGDMPMRGPGRGGDHMMVLSPQVEMDIERMGGPMRHCESGKEDCHLPAMMQAFRWQGLNLASVDASLGRYFGTSKGVLVVSSGPELKGLQSGDVIQRVAGSDVASPRDVMRALRERKEGEQVKVDVLRDHKAAAVTLTVPKARALPFMAPPPPPPAPPAPPAVPRTPGVAPPPPPAPPAAPAPPNGAPVAWVSDGEMEIYSLAVNDVQIIDDGDDGDDGEQIEMVIVPAAR
ncbi:PDZ domain-containing protein [Arenimonas oryziterrae]|uniref:PDZ domain-containing protein n=1 Tax=Arenimonas oryziterrae DSM 21050 = YC6267 TaxID=1121015 RepID=A0A091ATM3_9GAMM|nr:PDZ domain-containing protein [Arenimonas oryziterrae]KFN43528.1 hypothetical protein N789_09645 [Arenimonas oryziterrae DSM 21050 = YC6267]